MTENDNGKEINNAMAINEIGLEIEQLQDQIKTLRDQCDDKWLEIAKKETAPLKLFNKLIFGMDDLLLCVMSNSNNDVDRVLEAITTYDSSFAPELRRLGLYWAEWYQVLEYYRYFLTHRKFSGADYRSIHKQFARWLGDTVGKDESAYILAQAYYTWYEGKMSSKAGLDLSLD